MNATQKITCYYMTLDNNGCCSLSLDAENLPDAITEATKKMVACSEGATDLEDACELCFDGFLYMDAWRQLEGAGCRMVSGSASRGEYDSFEIWSR